MSLIGSSDTGTTSLASGEDSVVTADGICAPFPGLFLTDGASFATGGEAVATADSAPACGVDCTPGHVLINLSLPAEKRIATDSVATPPTYGVYEIPVGPFTCNHLRISVTADCQYVGGSTSIQVYLNDSGLPLSSRDFTSGNHLVPRLANIPTNPDGAYHTAVFVCYPALSPAFTDFAGPLPAQSVYIWVPALFPGFGTATCNIKNVRIQIVAI